MRRHASSSHGKDSSMASGRQAEYSLDDADLISNVESIVVSRQAHVSFLQAIRPNERIDLRGLDLVH